jgi:predicted RNA binding protein YcfA (HicA-like mRNA interferase family)
MSVPRDVSWRDVVRTLRAYDYSVTRQTGSHIRLTTERGGQHHITVPRHDPLRVGTLASILAEVAEHLGTNRAELVANLLGPRR